MSVESKSILSVDDVKAVNSLAAATTASFSWLQWLVQVLPAVLQVLEAKSASFRVGNYEVSVTENGTPSTFTWGSALVAVEMALSGQTGTVTIGVVQVSVGPYVAPTT